MTFKIITLAFMLTLFHQPSILAGSIETDGSLHAGDTLSWTFTSVGETSGPRQYPDLISTYALVIKSVSDDLIEARLSESHPGSRNEGFDKDGNIVGGRRSIFEKGAATVGINATSFELLSVDSDSVVPDIRRMGQRNQRELTEDYLLTMTNNQVRQLWTLLKPELPDTIVSGPDDHIVLEVVSVSKGLTASTDSTGAESPKPTETTTVTRSNWDRHVDTTTTPHTITFKKSVQVLGASYATNETYVFTNGMEIPLIRYYERSTTNMGGDASGKVIVEQNAVKRAKNEDE